ncbi:MAG: Fe-S protein assembly co-chaperone HscB [Saprospiraceae bacterium]|nr:Fe-S protein assembly co-chaperone HscB [Saprospiraceae bacterium]
MNYFELFGMPLGFEIDQRLLKRKYYELSKQFHPDKFTLHSDEEQVQALQKSTEVNKAYKVLKDKQSRIKYILEYLGVEFNEGNEKVSQEFLMEMMDINETLMELKFDPDIEKQKAALHSIEAIKTSLSDEIAPVTQKIDLNNPTDSALAQIKDYYLKSQYLKRLVQHLDH